MGRPSTLGRRVRGHRWRREAYGHRPATPGCMSGAPPGNQPRARSRVCVYRLKHHGVDLPLQTRGMHCLLFVLVGLVAVILPHRNPASLAQQRRSPIPPGWLWFSSERVVMSLWPGAIQVEGTYVFENLRKGTISATVCFPVAVDSEQAFPYDCEVAGHEFWTSVADTAIYWLMKVRPAAAETVRVRYWQQLADKKARYVLTTTQLWPRPVGEAEFVVSVPAEWEGVVLSMVPDSSWTLRGRRFYRAKRKDLRTDADLIVCWQ